MKNILKKIIIVGIALLVFWLNSTYLRPFFTLGSLEPCRQYELQCYAYGLKGRIYEAQKDTISAYSIVKIANPENRSRDYCFIFASEDSAIFNTIAVGDSIYKSVKSLSFKIFKRTGDSIIYTLKCKECN